MLKDISPETVVEQLEAGMREKNETVANPALLPPQEMVEYIIATHHAYLRSELPRLLAMTERVARVHGGHTPSLVEIHGIFGDMADELTSHMTKEEQILFPAIIIIHQGGTAMPLDGPISCMLHEHNEVGSALSRMRDLTDGFTPPSEACNTYRALFAGLTELENDLHRHIHLENSVLFPAALALAKA